MDSPRQETCWCSEFGVFGALGLEGLGHLGFGGCPGVSRMEESLVGGRFREEFMRSCTRFHGGKETGVVGLR
ncbi:hypothetical protein Scep_012955 [Stephania cephalantha]|uniref:Uncharacterized protein n=1 Tax=Stephania cephalantha TaxID=152367 RepID=A0AAP0JIC5_9MAGN